MGSNNDMKGPAALLLEYAELFPLKHFEKYGLKPIKVNLNEISSINFESKSDNSTSCYLIIVETCNGKKHIEFYDEKIIAQRRYNYLNNIYLIAKGNYKYY